MNDVHMRRESDISSPSVVITGATEGIGRALADQFASAGHTLLLVARDEAALAQTRAELSRAHGVRIEITAQDLSTESGCAGVEQALRLFGLHADILVNNAGIMSSGFFQDEELPTMLRLIDLDARAVVDLTLRFLPGMLARRRGGVLNVSSMTGYMPVPYQAAYAAAKAFVLSFSKSLSYETMRTGVTVSVVTPGAVETRLPAKAGTENCYYLQFFSPKTAEDVARAAYRGFRRGRSVIVPGILNPVGVLALRLVPDFLLVPLMGLLFRVRDDAGNAQQPGPLPEIRPATVHLSPEGRAERVSPAAE